MMKQAVVLSYFAAVCVCATANANTVRLSDLDISKTEQGWGQPQKNKSVDGADLSIGGVGFDNGLGTHAESSLLIDLHGTADRFTASVGVDDEVEGKGTVEFLVAADGKDVWRSGLMKGGQPARSVDVALQNVKQLELTVLEGKDNIDFDHADWGNAQITYHGAKPATLSGPTEEYVRLTPPIPTEPRINGPRITGVRPGHPFLFKVPASGDKPMRYAAEGLPADFHLDADSGIITGTVTTPGEYVVSLRVTNPHGEARHDLKIAVGDQIALTPPMGWNSWNCFAHAVTAERVKSAADAMVKSGLIDHGWQYINIDDFWECHRSSKDPTLQGPHRDADGRILPNKRFAEMKELVDYVHRLGLKIGLYSSPGPWTCGGCVASFDHEELDAAQYAAWGFDYLKYDWCSYRPELEPKRTRKVDLSLMHQLEQAGTPKGRLNLMRPYAIMRAALDHQNRDILFSLCQYGMGNVWEWGAKVGGNCWRTTGDIRDSWGSMSGIGFGQSGREKYAGPGHWNDPDMLVVGQVGWGHLHPSNLTPNEQYTHISLWCLLSSPLLIGCDMTQLDDFTLGLLENDEVLAVSQDELGKQAGRVTKNGSLEVWAKNLADGSKAVGLFNRGRRAAPGQVTWAELGLTGTHTVRDLWRQKDVGECTDGYTCSVPRHGVVLIRVR